MASATQASRNSGNKRRIPLGLLPYSSSSEGESEEENGGEPDATQLGGMMRRQRAATNTCAPGTSENVVLATHDKRRKTDTLAGQCKSSPLRASSRARQSPVREGMVDITQKGLSFAHSGGGQTKQAVTEPSRDGAGSASCQKQSTPAASAASAATAARHAGSCGFQSLRWHSRPQYWARWHWAQEKSHQNL